jgi:hypothetical protein
MSTASSDDKSLDVAATHFARAIVIIGTNGVIALLLRKGVAVKNTNWTVAALADEASTIEFPVNTRGALWSKLGQPKFKLKTDSWLNKVSWTPDSELARALARQDGRVTLEATLDRTSRGFFRMLEALPIEKVRPVFRVLSRAYARSLRGEVAVYTDLSALRSSAFNKESAILYDELYEIAEAIQAESPLVHKVIFKDVMGGGGFTWEKARTLSRFNN